MENPKPNYYAIIPANVRYCRDLQPGAKLLYGEITALCHQEGYCWATNAYFASLYEVDESTVKRWVRSLKENEFIFVEVENGDFKVSRKIYLFKEMFTKGQKCPDGGSKKNPGGGKNDLHNNTQNSTKTIVCIEPPKNGGEVCEKLHPNGKKFKVSLQEVISQAILQGHQDWTMTEIEEAWEIMSKYEDPIREWFKFIEGTINKIRIKTQPTKTKEVICQEKQQNQKMMEEVKVTGLSESCKKQCLENDTSGHLLANLMQELRSKRGWRTS